MEKKKPHPANVPGDFYVEDGCCTMCGVPFGEAEELFGTNHEPQGYEHCFVKRQPQTPDEEATMIRVIQCAELQCIRYRGHDPRIQSELIETGEGQACDDLPPHFQARVDAQEEKRRRQREEAEASKGTLGWKFWK